MKEITYHKEGDYLIMDNSCENYNIGKYGRLRLNFILKIIKEAYIPN